MIFHLGRIPTFLVVILLDGVLSVLLCKSLILKCMLIPLLKKMNGERELRKLEGLNNRLGWQERSDSELRCRFESTCWQEEGLYNLLWSCKFVSGCLGLLGCVIGTVAMW